MPKWANTFEGTLETLDYGRMVYTIVRLTKSLESQVPFRDEKKVRFVGRIGGQNVALAWLTDRGGHYCIVSKALARAAKVSVGGRVRVEFNFASEDDVEVPPEIREALRQEPAFRKPWKALSPGKQRGLSHMVAKTRSDELRAQRAVEILSAVAEGRVPGPPPRRRA